MKIAIFGYKAKGEGLHGHNSNARTETLMHIIEERVEPDSIVYTDMLEI